MEAIVLVGGVAGGNGGGIGGDGGGDGGGGSAATKACWLYAWPRAVSWPTEALAIGTNCVMPFHADCSALHASVAQ